MVEGWDDLFSVVGLMCHHVNWPNGKTAAPVFIHMGNGAEEILKDGFLSAFLKGSVVKTLGVMLDGDSKPRGRYDRIRTLCSQFFPTLPNELPKEGLVVDNVSEQKRFGLWIMPDNCSEGCLETFLRHLVPDPAGTNLEARYRFCAGGKGDRLRVSRRAHLKSESLHLACVAGPSRPITRRILDEENS